MNRISRQLTACLAIATWLLASLGYDCCTLGPDATAEGCCAVKKAAPVGPGHCSRCDEGSGKPSGATPSGTVPLGVPLGVCSCDGTVRQAMSGPQPWAPPAPSGVELDERSPSRPSGWSVTTSLIPFTCPTPPGRGPPSSHGLS